MNNNIDNFSVDDLISDSSFIPGEVSPNPGDSENLKTYQILTQNFTKYEIAFAYLTVFLFVAAYFTTSFFDIRYASLLHARILYAVFVSINVLAAIASLLSWNKIPSRCLVKDAMLFFTISMLSAAIGNTIDYIFWLTEIAVFKRSVFTNLFFIFAILFAMPGVHLLGRACRVEFSKQSFIYYLAIVFVYMLIPTIMNSSNLSNIQDFSNLKEFVFGTLYAVGIGYLAAVSIHVWRTARGRLVYSARLICLGLIAMSFGCSIYAGLFPNIPPAEIPSSPVHIIIALGYVFSALGIKRTESTINTIFNLKQTKLPPWFALVEIFGKNEGMEVYKRLEENIKTTMRELVKTKGESHKRLVAIEELEREIQMRKKAELELIAAKEKAEEANSAKTEFLAMMSHELKTPLTAIKGYGDLLSGPNFNKVNSEKLLEVARQIAVNANILHGMIDGILNFSQLESGQFSLRKENFKLQEILEVVQNIAKDRRTEAVKFIENIPDPQLELSTDRFAIQQIIVNLVTNAFKFCSEGKIILEIRQSGEKDILIAVQDTGIGIPSDELDRIFDAFYQVSQGTKRKFGGTGLGLSIVKRITQELNGKIEIDSQPGKGTRIEVFLPETVMEKDKDE
ncbi:MAG: hypothetical protein Kow0029_16690 [Candidatus Rifleibacteriota bacterium]